MYCGSLWPIFHGPVILPYTCILETVWYTCMNIILPVILPYILKTIWCMNIILWDSESVWINIWPQMYCGSLWPVFHSQVILPYILKTVWCMNIILRGNESIWINLWLIFHDAVSLPYTVLKTWTSYFRIMSQHDPTCYLKIFVGHFDLYFMVHWIGLVSWRLFDVWTLYIVIMSRCNAAFVL